VSTHGFYLNINASALQAVPTRQRFAAFKQIVEDPIPCIDGREPQLTGATFESLVIAPDKCILKANVIVPTPANVRKLDTLFSQRTNDYVTQALRSQLKPSP
jgi:N-methylhydantoinase B/oxoprolinase/acetone carboxylase alpha subunit